MLNGALTVGTMDGANVEIFENVGKDNIIIFGMSTPEVNKLRGDGYNPHKLYEGNPIIKNAVDFLHNVGGESFPDIFNNLVHSDYYMALADFDSYREAMAKAQKLYADKYKWNAMALKNISASGVFCADRSVNDYARDIWKLV